MRNMKTTQLLLNLTKIGFLFSLIILVYSCSRDNNECPTESLGGLQILPSTMENMPYKDMDIVYFKDHLQNEISYTAHIQSNTMVIVGNYTVTSSSGESTTSSSNAYSIPCENDPSQNLVFNYSYRSTYYYLNDTLNTLGLSLGMSLRLIAFKENGELQQADVLNIRSNSFVVGSKQNSYYSNYIILDQRTLADKYLGDFSQEINEITFLNKTFYNVHVNEDENIYYNKQQGFVAFLDSTNKIWVFDRLEEGEEE